MPQLLNVPKIKDAYDVLSWWLDPANRAAIETRFGSAQARNFLTGLQVMRDTLAWVLELPETDEAGREVAVEFQKNLDGLRDVRTDLLRFLHAKPELN